MSTNVLQRIEAEKQAEIDKERAAESAKNAEIKRQDDAKEAERMEQLRREANINLKREVNNVILDALIDNGLSVTDAKRFITLAAGHKLPRLTINY